MKKVYTYLAAVAAALVVFSCQTVPHDDSHVDEVVSAPNVAISVSEITDFTATVTIAPEGAANYYAYIVDESDEAEELDPEALYANKYSSVANGLVKYATSASTTVELEDLEPNTTYQVYAVAGSTTGVVGTVAVKSFLTTDKGTPTPGTPTKKENVLAVAFSEDVTYDATKPATAYYYAYNTAIIDKTDPENPELVFDGKVGEAKVDVAVDGATATFTVTLDGTNPLPAGAYYTVGYPAGAFVDAVGNPCPARTHVTGLTSKSELGFGGFYGRVSTKAFDLEYDKEREIVVPAEQHLDFPIPEGVTLFGYTEDANATMIIERSSATRESTTTYTLELDYDWGYSYKRNAMYIWFPVDVDIMGGDYVTYGIDAGSVEDIYGNTNAAFSQKYLYSFGYKMEDIYGTYDFAGKAYYAGLQADNGVVIAPFSSEEEEYKDFNVVIYNLFSNTTTISDLATTDLFDPTVLYGTVDLDRGTLIVGADAIGTAEDANYGVPAGTNVVPAALDGSKYTDFGFTIPEVGTMSISDPVYMVLWGLGYWDVYTAGVLTRTSTEYTEPNPSAAATSAKTSKVELAEFNSVSCLKK